MKEYVAPEMEIDVFEENSGLTTVDSGCICPSNLAYGSDGDPLG